MATRERHLASLADELYIDCRIAFVKTAKSIDQEILGEHAPSGHAHETAQFCTCIQAPKNG